MSYTGDGIGGVGGWLAFFVIVIGVLTPLAMILGNAADLYGDNQIALAMGSAWNSIQVATWGTVAIGLGLCWFIVYRLMRIERWSTVRITIAGIWLLAIGLNFAQILLLSLLSGIPADQIAVAAAVDIVRGIVFGIVWTSYFLLSKRVANTYRHDPEGEDLAERFA
jgi:hypothetical protein